MLSGAPPFKGSQTMTVIMKHVTEPVPRLADDLAAFQPLLDRMLAKERSKRPATEKEWQELIKPLFRPFKLPKAEKPELGDLARRAIAKRRARAAAAAVAANPPVAPGAGKEARGRCAASS